VIGDAGIDEIMSMERKIWVEHVDSSPQEKSSYFLRVYKPERTRRRVSRRYVYSSVGAIR